MKKLFNVLFGWRNSDRKNENQEIVKNDHFEVDNNILSENGVGNSDESDMENESEQKFLAKSNRLEEELEKLKGKYMGKRVYIHQQKDESPITYQIYDEDGFFLDELNSFFHKVEGSYSYDREDMPYFFPCIIANIGITGGEKKDFRVEFLLDVESKFEFQMSQEGIPIFHNPFLGKLYFPVRREDCLTDKVHFKFGWEQYNYAGWLVPSEERDNYWTRRPIISLCR